MTAPRTGRADTVYGVSLAVISVVMVLFGTVVVLVDRAQMETARARLDRTVIAVAEREQLSPRDPVVLRMVRRAMPPGVRLEPAQDFAKTGQLLLVWRGRAGGLRSECVLLPSAPSGRVRDCKRRTPASP